MSQSLSLSQRIARRLVSETRFARMQAESRAWVIEGSCGYRTNVWDAGGIRYKAHGEKRRWGRCPGCGKRHAFRVFKP